MSFKKPFRAIPVQLGEHYKAKLKFEKRQRTIKTIGLIVLLSMIVFGIGMIAIHPTILTDFMPNSPALMSEQERAQIEAPVHYQDCNAARSAGAAPLHAGSPGYRAELDRDGDGTACEPNPATYPATQLVRMRRLIPL